MSNCKHDRRFVRWEDHSRPIVCTLCEIERLERQVFDMGGLNDAWALEVDQLKAKVHRLVALLFRVIELREACLDEHGNSISENVRVLFFKVLDRKWWCDAIESTLPELTDEERAAMNNMDPNLVQTLWNEAARAAESEVSDE